MNVNKTNQGGFYTDFFTHQYKNYAVPQSSTMPGLYRIVSSSYGHSCMNIQDEGSLESILQKTRPKICKFPPPSHPERISIQNNPTLIWLRCDTVTLVPKNDTCPHIWFLPIHAPPRHFAPPKWSAPSQGHRVTIWGTLIFGEHHRSYLYTTNVRWR